MDFENRAKINNGIYTVPDVSKILRLPYQRVNYWLNKYWDSAFGGTFESRYSWTIDNTRAVSFHTLIEFYVFYHLSEVGVKPKEVLKAHIELSKMFDTPFPFAIKNVLESIRTTGKKIFLDSKDGVFSLDGNGQFNLDFIKMFFKSLDFDNDLVATRFYPLGKGRNIMIDPRRQFGHPVLGLTNIYPETIYNLYKAGEPIEFLAFTYELVKEAITDAIEYCEAA